MRYAVECREKEFWEGIEGNRLSIFPNTSLNGISVRFHNFQTVTWALWRTEYDMAVVPEVQMKSTGRVV
jgi:hypothetical protein